jgi:hypothetical protein
MWYLSIISGPGAGTFFPLKIGTNIIGRASSCDVALPSNSVSKEHARMEVYNDKIVITDLKSRNGTFINGVQVQTQKVRLGDKLAFFDIIAEVVQDNGQIKRNAQARTSAPQNTAHHSPSLNSVDEVDVALPPNQKSSQPISGDPKLISYLKKYIDDVVMPGVYKLTEWFEFRLVIGLFVTAFIVFVTTLSSIPLIRILKSSIEQESRNRALTIAKTISQLNRATIIQGLYTTISVEFATNEPGVKEVYVIRADNGQVIAPSQALNSLLEDIPGVATARKYNQDYVSQVDSRTIVAMSPVSYVNPATAAQTVAAFSVVLYDMDRLAVDSATTLSLFVQVLLIALILGGILFFFLQNVIEYPFRELNTQLNAGMSTGQVQLTSKIQFPLFNRVLSNINSAINRSNAGFSDKNIGSFESDRSVEISGILNLFGFPALAVQPQQKTVIQTNDLFTANIGTMGQWVGLSVDRILDQALKLNIMGLLDKLNVSQGMPVSDQLEINNQLYEITAQSIMGAKEAAYVIFVFIPRGG